MFTGGKSALALALFALVAQTAAHAIPNPALGVKGTPARSDVQRPSTAQPCGTINPATTLDTSTAVAANADGSVTLPITNFNAGADGSTSVAIQVDATGTGKSFVAATVSKNGNAAPTAVETDNVTFSLPAGTKCTGGTAGNLCLISVKTTAGFGACSVVSQGTAAATTGAATAAAGTNTTAAATTAAAGTNSTAAATGNTTTTATTGTTAAAGKKHHHHKGAAKAAAAVAANKKVGTRAARALRRELMEALERRVAAALE